MSQESHLGSAETNHWRSLKIPSLSVRDSAAPRPTERASKSADPETMNALDTPEMPGSHATLGKAERAEVREPWASRAQASGEVGDGAPTRSEMSEAAAYMVYDEFEECAGQLEHDMIRDALIESKWCLCAAARMLGIHRNTLDYKLRRKYPDLQRLRAPRAGRGKG